MKNPGIKYNDNINNKKNAKTKAVNQKSNFRRGSVELMVLHLLSQKDCYGYELTKLIDELTNGVIHIPIGSLYPSLYRLIEEGYITDCKRLVGKRMERVYYHIEDTGKERLEVLINDFFATSAAIQTVLSYHPERKNSRENT